MENSIIKQSDKKLLISARDVCMDYNSFTERTDGIKEAVIKHFR